ncbi:MAG: response regulator [Candidatus Solibacter sp.]|nr:response regulator [Candidatus Solibacter sp.]
MKSILFVDDEPLILAGLQRLLRSQREVWDMSFAGSGAEALAILKTKPIDAIVTDMRMPAMDGARLLEIVRERSPGTIRIVLSGYFESEAALRAVGVAHQYLAKPCDPKRLQEAIERACGFASLLPDAALRRVVGVIGSLPTLPRTSALLAEALRKPDIPLGEISRIVEHDVGITAKLLQLVNSAFFCLPYRVTSVSGAVSYLGLDTLRHLVLSVELFRTLKPRRAIVGFSLEGLEEHSYLAARIAATLPAAEAVTAEGVIASVLHDVGKLVLASRLPREFEISLASSVREQQPLHLVEKEKMGTTHAEIGAYLLGLWGLPGAVVDAVSRHHRPEVPETGSTGLDVLAITHIADALAYEAHIDQAGATGGLLNPEYLARLGLEANLPAWRAAAQQALADGQGT